MSGTVLPKVRTLLIEVPPATHGENVLAEFPDNFPSPADLAPLLSLYAASVVSFVLTGDPNVLLAKTLGAMAPTWTPYSDGQLQFVFNTSGAAMSGPDNLGREQRCAFWRSLGSIMPY
jgi:hypothetical protein